MGRGGGFAPETESFLLYEYLIFAFRLPQLVELAGVNRILFVEEGRIFDSWENINPKSIWIKHW